MKRMHVVDTIQKANADTRWLNPNLSLVNMETKEAVEMDMPTTLKIIRGTLAWVDELLAEDAEYEQDRARNMQRLLSYVGAYVAEDLSL